MLQPILGDVGVEVRIVDHCRKAENKPQAQPHRYEACPQKEPRMLPHQLTHRANIARLLQSAAKEKNILWTRRCPFLVDYATLSQRVSPWDEPEAFNRGGRSQSARRDPGHTKT